MLRLAAAPCAVWRAAVPRHASVRWKITDRILDHVNPFDAKARPLRHELTEDEQFFMDADKTAEEELLASLELERTVMDAKERLADATPEWQEYDREVTKVTEALEDAWLLDTAPITKETTAEALRKWETEVEKVQRAHEERNDARVAAYRQYRLAIASGTAAPDAQMPVSAEYAQLLDKFS